MNTGFQAFPEKLFNKPVRITNFPGFDGLPGIAHSKEVFYSIKDGNWNDPTIWETVSGRIGKIPTASDDVYIKNNVGWTFAASTTVTINNLFISSNGKLFADVGSGGSRVLAINGNIQCYGILDLGISSTMDLALFGYNNYIDKTKVASLQIVYYAATDVTKRQAILDLPYNELRIGTTSLAAGEKYLTSDVTCNSFTGAGVLSSCWVQLGSYNFTCLGALSSNVGFACNGNGSHLFVGLANFAAGLYCTENPTMEFRGGLTLGNFVNVTVAVAYMGSNLGFKSGNSTWNFTTNSQTITLTAGLTAQFDAAVLVATGITVTLASSTGIMQINNSLGGASGTANFTNKGNLYWNNASSYTYANGTFDKDTFNTNVVGYIFNGSVTLPYTTFQGLYIAGTGVKTTAGATTMGTTLTIASGGTLTSGAGATSNSVGGILAISGTLNMVDANWTFSSTASNTGTVNITKSGTGTVIFVGFIDWQSGCKINFSGNPNVEFRGGYNFQVLADADFVSGTGTWSYTTNNQNIRNYFKNYTYNCTISIASGITVTWLQSGTAIMNADINGVSGTSTLDSQNYLRLNNASFPTPMSTGVLTLTGSLSVIDYAFNGNYTLPYTSYQGLGINGTGTKTLGGNTTLGQGVIIGNASSGKLELSTFDFTVNGTTTVQPSGALSKTGAGTILFVGLVSFTNSTQNVEFTGNPTIELRGGAQIYSTGSAFFNSGTGLWTFSTNNQNFDMANGGIMTCPILISGAITITLVSTASRAFNFTNYIDGNNVASTLDNRCNTAPGVSYKSATMPMVTGVLKCNGAANLWKYDLAGAQDVQGGNTHLSSHQYWHLTLGGSGAKTLQGDVSVTGTYTLSGTATKNNNGFTFGNP